MPLLEEADKPFWRIPVKAQHPSLPAGGLCTSRLWGWLETISKYLSGPLVFVALRNSTPGRKTEQALASLITLKLFCSRLASCRKQSLVLVQVLYVVQQGLVKATQGGLRMQRWSSSCIYCDVSLLGGRGHRLRVSRPLRPVRKSQRTIQKRFPLQALQETGWAGGTSDRPTRILARQARVTGAGPWLGTGS